MIRAFFTKNLALKFISLVLAVALWVMAVGRERAEMGINVPLELVNYPKDMVITSPVPDGISVRIRGSITLTRQVGEKRLRFSLDLSQAKVGTNTFTLLPDNLGLPRGIEVTHLAPSTIVVQMEKIAVKQVSLLPVIKGEPQTGAVIEDITLDPKTVTIRGQQSVLETIDIIWTEPIDVTQVSSSTILNTKPDLPDKPVSLVEPVQIKAHLLVAERRVVRPLTDVPVEGINTELNIHLDPPVVAVKLRGPKSLVDALTPGETVNARVNLADLPAGVHERPVHIAVPPDVQILSVEPETIRVTLTPRENQESQ